MRDTIQNTRNNPNYGKPASWHPVMIFERAESESEGWNVIVENKLGAIQTIGLAEVLRQPADGYTIASIALPPSAAPALLPNVTFRLDMNRCGSYPLPAIFGFNHFVSRARQKLAQDLHVVRLISTTRMRFVMLASLGVL
jgi:hypothetical protein